MFHSRVVIANGSDFNNPANDIVVSWRNNERVFSRTVGQFVLTFRSDVTTFEDPTPVEDTDSDLDGIIDSVEAQLSEDSTGRAGDPAVRDIVLLAGFTHSAFAVTENAVKSLVTVFSSRGIRLFVMNDSDTQATALGLTPGQIKINGAIPDSGVELRLDAAVAARSDAIPKPLNPFTHYLVCGGSLDLTEGDGSFGRASLPGPYAHHARSDGGPASSGHVRLSVQDSDA